jgi:sugar lactone lactonase YvrE
LVAVDAADNIYVPDLYGGRVLIYQPINTGVAGQLSGILGQTGTLPGQFSYPCAVALDANGNIYVGDLSNRIQVFDPSGTYLRMWGSTGTGNGQFSYISGMQVDPNGFLWVADSAKRIQVFDTYGDYLETVGSPGTSLGQFNSSPQGMAFDPSGALFVADPGSDRVEHFNSCAISVPTPTPTPMAEQTYDLRVDVASNQIYQDQSGNYWLADQAFGGTQNNPYGYTQGGTAVSVSSPVSGTQDPLLYDTYRQGNPLIYQFDVQPGNYQVTLKMADFTATGPSQNVFNVLAQGQTVLPSVDVYGAVGRGAAYDRNFPVTVATGAAVTLQWNALSGHGLVSAIEVTALQPNPNPLNLYLIQYYLDHRD